LLTLADQFTFTEETVMKSTLAAFSLMVATSAFAAGPGSRQGAERSQALDTDGDGMVSLAEAQQNAPALASHFNELDTNRDGLLSREEIDEGRMKAGGGQSAHDAFAAADSNADDKLSREEVSTPVKTVTSRWMRYASTRDPAAPWPFV
jgi:hypothetical protein